jgi:hypothetical protein
LEGRSSVEITNVETLFNNVLVGLNSTKGIGENISDFLIEHRFEVITFFSVSLNLALSPVIPHFSLLHVFTLTK